MPVVSKLVPNGVEFVFVTLWCMLAVVDEDPDVVSVNCTVPNGVGEGSSGGVSWAAHVTHRAEFIPNSIARATLC